MQSRPYLPQSWLAIAVLCVPALATAQTSREADALLKRSPQPDRAPTKAEAPAAAPRKAQSAPAGGTPIQVRAYEFYGNTLLSAEELQQAVAGHRNRPLTLLQIYELADQLTTLYVSRGYTLATVNVPAQRIENGIVRLEVIEGRVGQVRFENLNHYRPSSLSRYLDGVRSGYAYQGAQLAEGLTRLNEIPGLSTRAVLRPGELYGTSDVVVQATESRFAGSTSFDNYGREDVGEFRFTAAGTFNSPLNNEDQLQVLGLVSEDALLTYGYIAYDMAASYNGTRLTLSYGVANFEVDGAESVEGENEVARVRLSQPLMRRGHQRLDLGAGLSHTSGETDIEGREILAGSSLNLFETDLDYQHGWASGGASQATLQLASNFRSAEFGDDQNHQKLRADLDLLHLQPLPWRLELLLRAAGAWSPDPLPQTQKFSLGGPGSVRGFPSSEARGDRGVLGSITLRRTYTLGPVALTGSLFADAGHVRSVTPQGVSDSNQALRSAGLGVEARYQRLSAKLDWSFPIDHDEDVSDDRDDSRVFGTLAFRF